ncbi:AraC family transcriptional regulator [uncultured Halopseudomonas sp.]|uniref:AraC family transcriptional regulator n=1 Tax=uncultured Halopseudomonas sp. TaxID=2901193 RepID=UPI0030EB60AD
MKLGDLSVGYLYSLRAALHNLGHDVDPLLQRFRITPETLSTPQARISIARFMRLGNAAIALSGRADIGLLMGEHSRASHLGLAGLTAQCAMNLHRAFDTLVRFERLSSQNYRGHSSFDAPALRFYSISPYNAFNLFVVDSALSSRARLGKQLTGGEARLEAVHIEFPAPAYAESYEQVFKCPVLFGQEHNQLIWQPASLERSLDQAAPATFNHLQSLCEAHLQELGRYRRLRERVEEIVSPQLHQQLPGLSDVARELGMASWTLRRKLQQQENTRFQDIIDDTRRDLALSYVRDTELALGEIAFLLGFSSPGAFQRAFKRWTAQPPGQFRREQRQMRS